VRLALDAGWLARLRARADEPPRVPREPLWLGNALVGSVEPGFFERLRLPHSVVREHSLGWQVQGETTASLDAIAHAMRDAGLAHVWRGEQLAVTDESGRALGSIERAAVRPLGIRTHAVHMAGFAPDGRHWVQQRSLDKANDPGLWDTLMGGMVPAGESLQQALARETWEEAGLALAQLRDVRHRGRIATRRPTDDSRGGYVVEDIDWFTCFVPEAVEPRNQDGEVARFLLLGHGEVARMLLGDEFTLEASLVLSESAR
jgi:8-oxo-dGTP pyrophosphatase MutT (NUDIX family)